MNSSAGLKMVPKRVNVIQDGPKSKYRYVCMGTLCVQTGFRCRCCLLPNDGEVP